MPCEQSRGQHEHGRHVCIGKEMRHLHEYQRTQAASQHHDQEPAERELPGSKAPAHAGPEHAEVQAQQAGRISKGGKQHGPETDHGHRRDVGKLAAAGLPVLIGGIERIMARIEQGQGNAEPQRHQQPNPDRPDHGVAVTRVRALHCAVFRKQFYLSFMLYAASFCLTATFFRRTYFGRPSLPEGGGSSPRISGSR